MNQRQHSLTHIVFEMIFFLSICLAFSNFRSKFDQKKMWFNPSCPIKDSIKNSFFQFQTFIKTEKKKKKFDLYSSFKTLSKCPKTHYSEKKIWINKNTVWPLFFFQESFDHFFTKYLIWFDLVEFVFSFRKSFVKNKVIQEIPCKKKTNVLKLYKVHTKTLQNTKFVYILYTEIVFTKLF